MWKKILNITFLVLKILGAIALIVVTGKFLTDFFGSSKKIKTELSNFKHKVWKKDSDDSVKETIENQELTDEIIEQELDKIDDS